MKVIVSYFANNPMLKLLMTWATKNTCMTSKKLIAALLCLSLATGQASAINFKSVQSLPAKVKALIAQNPKTSFALLAAATVLVVGAIVILANRDSSAQAKKPSLDKAKRKLLRQNAKLPENYFSEPTLDAIKKAIASGQAAPIIVKCKCGKNIKNHRALKYICKVNNFELVKLFVEQGQAQIKQVDIDATTNNEIKEYLKNKLARQEAISQLTGIHMESTNSGIICRKIIEKWQLNINERLLTGKTLHEHFLELKIPNKDIEAIFTDCKQEQKQEEEKQEPAN